MPQVKESILRILIKEALKEAELTAGPENTKFSITVDVGNPQSETKLGVRIQLRPKEGFLEPDKKDQLSVAIMKKLNTSLGKYDIQISKDTDVPDPEVLGFFIPLSQLKNMIINTLKGPSQDSEEEPDTPLSNDRPPPGPPPGMSPMGPPPPTDKEDIEEQIDWSTGISLKRSKYGNEIGGQLTIDELYEKIGVVRDLLAEVFKDILESDYEFKDYYTRNEEHISRTQAIIELIHEELSDRIEQNEPVGPDQGIEELKKVIKTQLNEMRVRDLKEISGVVIKEDFYNFINAGNNVLRTLEERAPHLNGKKYLEYLVKHNIM